MRKWLDRLAYFYRDKRYVAVLCLTAACSYGFLITHSTVGIDDTPYSYYFEEGLVAIVGRWVLFLLNKILRIADYAPFLTDLAGVLLLMMAVTVWCALFYSILGETIPRWGYLFFGGIFLSCPLISEVYTYHLHNGISIGYLSCGISLCFFREGLEKVAVKSLEPQGHSEGKRLSFKGLRMWIPGFLGSAVFMWIAIGCYESFMIVWLLGVFLVLLTMRFAGVRVKVFRSLLIAAMTAATGMVLRSLMIALVTKVFGLEYLRDDAVQRSVAEMAAWMTEPGARAEFAMVLKRIFVMYGVFAYAYYPIRVFLLAAVAMTVMSIWQSIRRRDLWILFLTVGSFAVSFLLVIVEGKATLYRSAQFLPVICGYGALLFVYGVWDITGKRAKRAAGQAVAAGQSRKTGGIKTVCRGTAVFLLFVILWNQCMDMNRWFYVDYRKYEAAQNTARQIAQELQAGFDISKPVMFAGTYEVPYGVIEDAYIEYNSETFYGMKQITSLVDEHLLEKFYRPYGVWVAQTPSLSVIDWGRYAFDDNSELIRFFAMEGYELQPFPDIERYQEAEEYAKELPHFPAEGSIVDMGDYIIVHF